MDLVCGLVKELALCVAKGPEKLGGYLVDCKEVALETWNMKYLLKGSGTKFDCSVERRVAKWRLGK